MDRCTACYRAWWADRLLAILEDDLGAWAGVDVYDPSTTDTDAGEPSPLRLVEADEAGPEIGSVRYEMPGVSSSPNRLVVYDASVAREDRERTTDDGSEDFKPSDKPVL